MDRTVHQSHHSLFEALADLRTRIGHTQHHCIEIVLLVTGEIWPDRSAQGEHHMAGSASLGENGFTLFWHSSPEFRSLASRARARARARRSADPLAALARVRSTELASSPPNRRSFSNMCQRDHRRSTSLALDRLDQLLPPCFTGTQEIHRRQLHLVREPAKPPSKRRRSLSDPNPASEETAATRTMAPVFMQAISMRGGHHCFRVLDFAQCGDQRQAPGSAQLVVLHPAKRLIKRPRGALAQADRQGCPARDFASSASSDAGRPTMDAPRAPPLAADELFAHLPIVLGAQQLRTSLQVLAPPSHGESLHHVSFRSAGAAWLFPATAPTT